MASSIKIRSVRPAPPGFRSEVIGLVTFSFSLDFDDDPVKITRWVKAKNDQGEGKEYEVGSIPVGTIRVTDACLCTYTDHKTNRTRHYITSNPIALPRAVADEVASLAFRQLSRSPANEHPGASQSHAEHPRSGNPIGDYDGDPNADSFERGNLPPTKVAKR